MTIDEFQKVELRVAKVLAAERVEGSEKLVKLQISLGESAEGSPSETSGRLSGERQIIAGIGKAYTPETLIGREIVMVANLDPRVFTIKKADEAAGVAAVTLESQGMLLAAHGEDGSPVLLMPEHDAPPGSKIS